MPLVVHGGEKMDRGVRVLRWDNRLTRVGHMLEGNVLSIHIHPGLVKAKVIGRKRSIM